MYSLACLIHLHQGAAEELSRALGELGAAVAPVIEGSYNGGDLSAHFAFPDEAAYRTARPMIDRLLAGDGVVRADTAFFANGPTGVRQPALGSGILRTLLLCADHDATQARVERFEAEMVRMPDHIAAIRNWRLSRVIEASGELGWTHVWEQEFADLGGLLGPYMLHPYHWAYIDRWFDPECPDWLVNVRLCHSFCAYGRPILSGHAGTA